MTNSLPASGAELEMAGKDEVTAPPILAEEPRDGRPKIGFE